MPVYKIAAKRALRKEKEDANGVSALKAAMRDMGDLSASESDSDSDDEEESESDDSGSALSDEDGMSPFKSSNSRFIVR